MALEAISSHHRLLQSTSAERLVEGGPKAGISRAGIITRTGKAAVCGDFTEPVASEAQERISVGNHEAVRRRRTPPHSETDISLVGCIAGGVARLDFAFDGCIVYYSSGASVE